MIPDFVEEQSGDTYAYCPKKLRFATATFAVGLIGGFVVILVTRGPGQIWIILGGFAGLAVIPLGMIWLIRRSHRNERITFNDEARTIRLEHMHFPTSFFDWRRKPDVIVPYDDIEDVIVRTHRGNSVIHVRTQAGRFRVGETFERFYELSSRLNACEPDEPKRALMDRWWMHVVLGVGLLAFVLGVCYLLVFVLKVI